MSRSAVPVWVLCVWAATVALGAVRSRGDLSWSLALTAVAIGIYAALPLIPRQPR